MDIIFGLDIWEILGIGLAAYIVGAVVHAVLKDDRISNRLLLLVILKYVFSRFVFLQFFGTAISYCSEDINGFKNRFRFVVVYVLCSVIVLYVPFMIYFVNWSIAELGFTFYVRWMYENLAWAFPYPLFASVSEGGAVEPGGWVGGCATVAAWVWMHAFMFFYNKLNLKIENYSDALAAAWVEYKEIVAAKKFAIEKIVDGYYRMSLIASVDDKWILSNVNKVSTNSGVRIIRTENYDTNEWRFTCGELNYGEISPGKLCSFMKFNQFDMIPHSVNGKANLQALWTIPAGFDISTVFHNWSAYPHMMVGGPTNMGKGMFCRGITTGSIRQDYNTLLIVMDAVKKGLDFNGTDYDLSSLSPEFIAGMHDGHDDESEIDYIHRTCPRLDNFILVTDENAIPGVVQALQKEFDRRMKVISGYFGVHNYYDLVNRNNSKGDYASALDVPRMPRIIIYWPEWNTFRESYKDDKKSDIGMAVQWFNRMVLYCRSLGVSLLIDGQEMTIEAAGHMRKNATKYVIGASSNEIKYTLEMEYITKKVIGLVTYLMQGMTPGIGQFVSGELELLESAMIMTEANKLASQELRDIAGSIRMSAGLETSVSKISRNTQASLRMFKQKARDEKRENQPRITSIAAM